jgi:hypothetical protein
MSKPEKNDSKTHYMDGVDEFVEAVTGGEDEDPPKPKPKTDYRKKIVQEAARRTALWKLRKKQDDSGKPPKPATPKTPATPGTKPAPKKHGDAPQPPSGQEYYWYEPKPRKASVTDEWNF